MTTAQRPDVRSMTTAALKLTRNPLDAIFSPRAVAVIGATESSGSVGAAVMRNLLQAAFAGKIFPVNLKRPTVMGRKAFPSVREIGEPIDLAVIAAPSAAVPDIIGQCADLNIPGAVIISAGFKEAGPEGVELERRVLVEARRGGMRIIGPNCLGVMNPHVGLNATFAAATARPGNVGFISQSGALCTAILDWSLQHDVGFSSFISVGSMLDVGWGDLIDYLGDDPYTKSIVCYMESIGNAHAFVSAAREVALSKPIIVIKVGRTDAASKAAASHTGALTGSDEVLDAALRRVGALRVETISEMFEMVDVLARQPRPAGPRLTIVTNAGGPGVLATDMLIGNGGELAPVPPDLLGDLNKLLPPHWSHGNPIDVLGDASPDRYADAAAIATTNPNSDGTLVILTPQAMTDPTETARKLATVGRTLGKPILASWMGGESVGDAKRIFSAAGIPNFDYPDAAARAFCAMWQYSSNLNALYETPSLPPDTGTDNYRREVAAIIDAARQSGRTVLDEFESKQILYKYGLPIVETIPATTEDEALIAANRVGYPVVLKLLSKTITHKTDVGGVRLDLHNADAVCQAFEAIERSVTEKVGREHFQGVTVQRMIKRSGYEIILGCSIDPQFGPVLLFGSGGQLVEVFKDRALGLPPLNMTLARRLMEQTKIFNAFKGVRGRKPVDLDLLATYLVRFSQLVVEQRWIKEIDINPLLVSDDGIIALDARVIAFDKNTSESQLPSPAIRPYPIEYSWPFKMKSGAAVTIRPIRPEDEPMMTDFHRGLSEKTVHQRYFGTSKLEERISHHRLRRICFNDFDREIVLVVDRPDPTSGEHAILGVGRLSKFHGQHQAEFAIVVSTAWQGHWLGTELLKRLIEIARREKVRVITAQILADNQSMLDVSRKLGFTSHFDASGGVWNVSLSLPDEEPAKHQ